MSFFSDSDDADDADDGGHDVHAAHSNDADESDEICPVDMVNCCCGSSLCLWDQDLEGNMATLCSDTAEHLHAEAGSDILEVDGTDSLPLVYCTVSANATSLT